MCLGTGIPVPKTISYPFMMLSTHLTLQQAHLY